MNSMMSKLSEADFMAMVIDRAQARGWRVHHGRPARTTKGWRTPITGHPGFPDLVLARDGNVIIVELKSERGRLTLDQRAWLEALSARVWRPSDWPDICAILDAPNPLEVDVRISQHGDASPFDGGMR